MVGFLLRKKRTVFRIIVGSLSGSVLFYLITNFGVWLTGMGISPIRAGVYADGTPLFRNMLLGGLFFPPDFLQFVGLIVTHSFIDRRHNKKRGSIEPLFSIILLITSGLVSA